jgi:hypothetical protein
MKPSIARLAAVFMALVVAALGVAVTSSPSYAASCSGYGCDGTDPSATGCSVSSSTILTTHYAGGLLELRWGPNCQTNWARFTAADNATYSVWVTRLSDGVWAGNGLYNPLTFSNNQGNGAYTDQVYSPGAASACVQSPQHGGQTCLRQSS